MTSEYWAWLHWTVGRLAIVLGLINIFLGFGRYRTWYNLGSWPELAFAIYIALVVLVGCLCLHWLKGN